MNVLTLLVSMRSKSLSLPSKNSGVYANSASHPKIPAPIHPMEAPYPKCSFPLVLPPNVDPIDGVNSQSARADTGASTSARAANIAHFFNMSLPLLHYVSVPAASAAGGIRGDE